MPFWIHFIIGGVMLLGGAWLVWFALTVGLEGVETFPATGNRSGDTAPPREDVTVKNGSGRMLGLHAAKLRPRAFQSDGVQGLRMEIYDHGQVNMGKWAGKIANNIYIRAGKVHDAHVEDVLKPALKGQYKDIESAESLHQMGWIQVIVHPSLMDNLRHHEGRGATDLAERLRGLVLESLGICFTPAVHAAFQPYLGLFEDDSVPQTSFHLRFQPLPPASSDQPLDCQAAIGLKTIQAVSTVPGLEETNLRVADKELDGRTYAPLSERYAERLAIGPRSWCHLRTTADAFDSLVTIGWRPSNDRRIAGQIQILEYRGKDELWLELPGHPEKVACKKDWYIDIPAAEGPHTMAYFWCRREGGEENIGSLFLANPVPDIGALPEVVVIDQLEDALDDGNAFSRFIATQIYLASLETPQSGPLVFLDDGNGWDFLNQAGLAEGRNLLPEAVLASHVNLHYRVKMVLSPPQYRMVKMWFGKIATRQSVLASVMKTLKEAPVYRELFSEVLNMLLPDERRPGLSVDLWVDNLIPRGTALLRLLPILENVRRREIFGEIRLEQWQNARDISGMSCNAKRNFLIEYPSGNIMMRLSRYPLYGVHAPQITGFIGLSLEDPEDPACRLTVENGSTSELQISIRPMEAMAGEMENELQNSADPELQRLPPDQELGLPIQPGTGYQIHLAMGAQSIQILIYPDPVPQMNEPEFVPAPGKLDFFGLVLGRRAEISQWQSSPLAGVWNQQSQNGHFQLDGANRVTHNGFLASVIRDQTEREIHFLSTRPATVQEGLNNLKIEAGGSTLGQNPLGMAAQIFEEDAPGQVTQYERVAIDEARNAKVLLHTDFFERYFDRISGYLPEGERLVAVDLLKCFPGDISELDRHLYLVKSRSKQTQLERGWIFRDGGGIHRVGSGPRLQTMALDVSQPVVGPFDLSHFYTVDWQGGKRTPLSFVIESHREQVSRYLEDGWCELRKDMAYAPGGNLSAEPKVFAGRDPLFMVTNQLKLTYNAQTRQQHNQLNFDPRELCNYFDKDAYRLGYLPEAKAFTLRSRLHPNMGTTPKTVFLVVPSGEQAILGSHALDYVDIPPGRNILVLPGLAFRFSQGPAYYGVTV